MTTMNEDLRVGLAYLVAVRHLLLPAPRSRDQAGAGVAETVILVAIFAAGAIAIGGLIISKFTDRAGSIPTGP